MDLHEGKSLPFRWGYFCSSCAASDAFFPVVWLFNLRRKICGASRLHRGTLIFLAVAPSHGYGSFRTSCTRIFRLFIRASLELPDGNVLFDLTGCSAECFVDCHSIPRAATTIRTVVIWVDACDSPYPLHIRSCTGVVYFHQRGFAAVGGREWEAIT